MLFRLSLTEGVLGLAVLGLGVAGPAGILSLATSAVGFALPFQLPYQLLLFAIVPSVTVRLGTLLARRSVSLRVCVDEADDANDDVVGISTFAEGVPAGAGGSTALPEASARGRALSFAASFGFCFFLGLMGL
jgi:hypothetical protein